jgi:hypothetical protein
MDALDKVIVLERGPLAPLQSAMAKLAADGSTLGKLEGAWVSKHGEFFLAESGVCAQASRIRE